MSVPPSDDIVSSKLPWIVGIEVLHLDAVGYGPMGAHTRRQWRDACLEALRSGRDQFQRWTTEQLGKIKVGKHTASFAVRLSFSDGQTLEVMGEQGSQLERSALDFAGVEFDESLNLKDYRFATDCLFVGTSFRGESTFRGTTWLSSIHVEHARFFARTDWRGAQFNNRQGAFFHHSWFAADALFLGAIFSGVCNLRGCHFSAAANFHRVQFQGDALFDDAGFAAAANFERATFSQEAEFDSVKFEAAATFDTVTFAGPAAFEVAEFSGSASFFKAVFEHEARFVDAKFGAQINFENATFQNVGHFEGAIFLRFSPSFLAVKLETTLVFSRAEYFPEADTSPTAVKNYEFLKQLSEAQGQTEQALDFNALELRARRHLHDVGIGFRIVTALYEYLSSYGRSFTRPLALYVSLVLLTFAIAAVHAALNSPEYCPNAPELRVLSDLLRDDQPCDQRKAQTIHLSGYRAAVEYAVYRAAGVLDFADNDKQTEAINRRLFREPIEPWWMRAYGIFKAIASTALLFLVALGLRNNYRLK